MAGKLAEEFADLRVAKPYGRFALRNVDVMQAVCATPVVAVDRRHFPDAHAGVGDPQLIWHVDRWRIGCRLDLDKVRRSTSVKS